MIVLAITLLAAAGLPGCTHFRGWLHNGFKVGPEYRKPAAPVARDWIEFNDPRLIAEPAQDRDWWRVFDDPALDSLVQSTYQGNLDLRRTGLQVLEYRAHRTFAVGNLFPQQQTVDGLYRHFQLSSAGNSIGVADTLRTFDLWRLGAGLNWELDVWGRYRRAIEQRDADLERQVELYDDVLAIKVAETAQAYTEIRMYQERLRLARENVKVQQGSLKLATSRFEAGAVSELDVTQARSTLRETEALIPRFQAELRQANNRLCVLQGIPPRDLTPLLGRGPIPTGPSSVAVGIPAELIRRRPDVRAAERRVASASAVIGIATADLFPEFRISGSFSWSASELSDLFTPAAFGGSIGPSFNWRILNYGRLVNNIRVQEARFQQAAVDYQNTVLNANREVEDALIAFFKAQERAERLAGAVEATERSVSLATIQYREGAVDFERIFNLQNVLVRQQDNLALAQAEIAQSLIGVYKALRGGWQIRLEGPPSARPSALPPVREPPGGVEEVGKPAAEEASGASGVDREEAGAVPPLPEAPPKRLPAPGGQPAPAADALRNREGTIDGAAAPATAKTSVPLIWRKR